MFKTFFSSVPGVYRHFWGNYGELPVSTIWCLRVRGLLARTLEVTNRQNAQFKWQLMTSHFSRCKSCQAWGRDTGYCGEQNCKVVSTDCINLSDWWHINSFPILEILIFRWVIRPIHTNIQECVLRHLLKIPNMSEVLSNHFIIFERVFSMWSAYLWPSVSQCKSSLIYSNHWTTQKLCNDFQCDGTRDTHRYLFFTTFGEKCTFVIQYLQIYHHKYWW